MKQFEPLSNHFDLEVLRVLWETEESLTKSEIVDRSTFIKYNSAGLHIQRLLEKGIIQIADFKQTKTSYARAYTPVLSYEEYIASLINRPQKTPKLKLGNLLSALCDDVEISEETLAELEGVIKKYREDKKE
ncbi:BlaI/MecI/CopY family transcriptional regulator [Oscillospiraceae bacterium OttesenSCG-928-F05]|nr:BlaI/MecI/CopY family transcriptional regulator [Oscillospiraceae bacterium OttesenSCG-928-F05]